MPDPRVSCSIRGQIHPKERIASDWLKHNSSVLVGSKPPMLVKRLSLGSSNAVHGRHVWEVRLTLRAVIMQESKKTGHPIVTSPKPVEVWRVVIILMKIEALTGFVFH